MISIRFRRAYRAQERELRDLPYRQPWFPLLPVVIVVLAVLMFAAQGWAAVKEDPFEAKVCPKIFVKCFFCLLTYLVVERCCDVHRVGTLRYPICWLYDLGTVLPEGEGGRV